MAGLGLLLLCSLLQLSVEELTGHLKPLGAHKPPTRNTAELNEVPQPKQFYDDYVRTRRPVVFRGAAMHSGAFKRWDVEGLIENYGDLVVRLEPRHEQSSEIPVTDIGIGRSTIRYFASNYRSMDAYVISQVPEPMERDVMIPPCLRCGTFAKSIQEVHLFIVGKGGKTLLHRDPHSNIHCVFNGTKDWIMIEDDMESNLYQSPSSVDEFGGFSLIDIDEVDFERFPRAANIEYSIVTLNKGDCMFVPGGFWHQVRVLGEYNTAVSIWFSRSFKCLQQDWSDCDRKFGFTPMSDVEVIWRYSGGNTSLTQGHVDLHVMRAVLLSAADNRGRISLERFVRDFIVHRHDNDEHVIEQIKQVFNVTGDVITTGEVRGWSMEILKRVVVIIDPSDPSNSIDIELSVIDEYDVRSLLDNLKSNHRPLTLDALREEYSKLGGSDAMSRDIFSQLDSNGDDVITTEELLLGRDDVIDRFESALDHDPRMERKWMRYLRARDEL